jgi:8-oxo-dGTP pyrophosphatase MutT (NUDIX family)
MTVLDDRFAWFPGPLPGGLAVVQLYGWLFDDHGRVLVQRTPDGFNLPGGAPEPQDGSLGVTLAREAMEESQVLLSDMVVLGYERPQSPAGSEAGYVRAAARVTRVLPRRPDPDGGRLLGRVMVAWPRAVELLAWGPAGAQQGQVAAGVAGHVWGLPVHHPSLPDADLP